MVFTGEDIDLAVNAAMAGVNFSGLGREQALESMYVKESIQNAYQKEVEEIWEIVSDADTSDNIICCSTKEKFDEFDVEFDHEKEKPIFKNDDDFEDFYENYNLEPDEQSIG